MPLIIFSTLDEKDLISRCSVPSKVSTVHMCGWLIKVCCWLRVNLCQSCVARGKPNVNVLHRFTCQWFNFISSTFAVKCHCCRGPVCGDSWHQVVLQYCSWAPLPACFQTFTCSSTPDSNDKLCTKLCWSLITTHSFESGVLEQGSILKHAGQTANVIRIGKKQNKTLS